MSDSKAPPIPTSTLPPPGQLPLEAEKQLQELEEAVEGMGGVITPLPASLNADYSWLISESPCSFYTVVYRVFKGGVHWVGVTTRGVDPIDTLDKFEALMAECEKRNWEAPRAAQPAESIPPSMPAGHANYPPMPPAQPTAPPDDQGVVDRGTGELHSITVEINPSGGNHRVKFMVGRLNYPLTDVRSPEIIAGLFDANLGWTADHFRTPTVYDLRNSGLKADWQKKLKNVKGENKTYYDIVRIHS